MHVLLDPSDHPACRSHSSTTVAVGGNAACRRRWQRFGAAADKLAATRSIEGDAREGFDEPLWCGGGRQPNEGARAVGCPFTAERVAPSLLQAPPCDGRRTVTTVYLPVAASACAAATGSTRRGRGGGSYPSCLLLGSPVRWGGDCRGGAAPPPTPRQTHASLSRRPPLPDQRDHPRTPVSATRRTRRRWPRWQGLCRGGRPQRGRGWGSGRMSGRNGEVADRCGSFYFIFWSMFFGRLPLCASTSGTDGGGGTAKAALPPFDGGAPISWQRRQDSEEQRLVAKGWGRGRRREGTESKRVKGRGCPFHETKSWSVGR